MEGGNSESVVVDGRSLALGLCGAASAVWQFWFYRNRTGGNSRSGPGHRFLWFPGIGDLAVHLHSHSLSAARDGGDGSRQFLQQSDHADFLGRLRGNRGPDTATIAAAMNMMGNFARFVAPVVGGLILQRTGGD